jgi:hypothetical protein
MTHSPAPWNIGGSVEWVSYGDDVIISHDRQEICKEVFNRNDANLIAAAPDLLEALKDLLFHMPEVNDDGTISGGYDAIQSAKAAISKAEPNEIT